MAFNRLNIKSAVKSHSREDLSFTHLTTMNFGELLPTAVIELMPGDKIPVKAKYFSRMAPLAVPTYGRFSLKSVAAFVPLYQLADDADAYINSKYYHQGDDVNIRYFSILDLVNFLIDGNHVSVVSSTDYYDFSYIDASGNTQYRAFKPIGKYYYKILCCLGYAIPSNIDLRTTSAFYADALTRKLSAFPLLAFVKVYNDYMSNSLRYNHSGLTTLLNHIKVNKSFTTMYSNGHINDAGILALLEDVRVQFEPDYFTTAWQYANKPLAAIDQRTTISIPGATGVSAEASSDNVHLKGFTLNNLPAIATRYLEAFYSFYLRNNYSGSRAVNNVFSRMGIKTEDFRANYAHIIRTDKMPVNVGDVTSTAQTEGADLGDYAGKGIVAGGNQFSYDSKDYGFLLNLCYITVNPMYAFGFDKHTLRVDPMDFYHPEFDGLGPEAISYGEVFTNPRPDADDTTLDNQVFGFTERYNSYRFHRDYITGDFRHFDQNEMNAWHTGRLLNGVRKAGRMVAQSVSMNEMEPVSSEFDRIFANNSGDEDKFYLAINYDISDAFRPMLSHSASVGLGTGQLDTEKNGQIIS